MSLEWASSNKRRIFKLLEVILCTLLNWPKIPKNLDETITVALFVKDSPIKNNQDLFLKSLCATVISRGRIILFLNENNWKEIPSELESDNFEIHLIADEKLSNLDRFDRKNEFLKVRFPRKKIHFVGEISTNIILHSLWFQKFIQMVTKASRYRRFWINAFSLGHYEPINSFTPHPVAFFKSKDLSGYKLFRNESKFPVVFQSSSKDSGINFIFDFFKEIKLVKSNICVPEHSYTCDLSFRNVESEDSRSRMMSDLVPSDWPINLKKYSPYHFIRYIQSHIDYGKFSCGKIDLVIPVLERDLGILKWCVKGARENILNPIGQIYIVAPRASSIEKFCKVEGCVFVDEKIVVPIERTKINYTVNGMDRSRWIFQQFIKLNVDSIADRENILVIDSDTVLIRKQAFEVDGKFILRCSDEFHLPYYRAIKRVLKTNFEFPLYSLTAHQMIFSRKYLAQMKSDIEAKNPGFSWYEAILSVLDKNEPSSFSDYEVYGQWLQEHKKDEILVQYWRNLSLGRVTDIEMKEVLNKLSVQTLYDSLSFHHHFKKKV